MTCRSVLGALIKHRAQPWTYQQIADEAGVAKTTVTRYTKPEVSERMSARALLALREDAGDPSGDLPSYGRFVHSYYARLLESATPLGYAPDGQFYYKVNTSCLRHLQSMGLLLGWNVAFDQATQRVWVSPLVREDTAHAGVAW